MDWANPTLVSQYTGVLADINTKVDAVAKFFEGESHTNIPVGTKRINPTTKELERWSGSQWVEWDTRLKDHLANTSNPHGTTAAQVGAATSADFNNHVANTSNPHSVTAAQVGAPTTATFNAHVADGTKHPTSAAQIGGLLTANALSELAPAAATARNSIGAASAATLSSHMASTSNPHNVTRAQIGAAANGSNGDITALTACGSVSASGGSDLIVAGQNVNVYQAGVQCWRFEATGKLIPIAGSGTRDIGSDSNAVERVYASTAFRWKGATKAWSFFSYTPLTSLNPSGANAQDCANAINSLAKYLEEIGLVN